MNSDKNLFNNVSLLITHYNRSASLERLLEAFVKQETYFNEIIVSDDYSKPIHLDYLKDLQKKYNFTLVTTPINKGLANNLNKGQLAVKTPYTLYVQEDFVPTEEFLPHFKDALEILNNEPTIDIARFYAYSAYPYLKPYKLGYSEVTYKPWFLNPAKIYGYTDHPHLRRSTFFEKFGMYTEGIKSDKTEYEMCVSFIQNKGRAIFYDGFKDLFIQENSAAEPSTVTRNDWRQGTNPILATTRWIYRTLKYNYDLHIDTKFKK
jgi:glycosyltransferase involved in cell wall biosynthesis